jgi:hypothetical protein
MKDREYLSRHFLVAAHARTHADGLRAAPQRLADRHSRAHAELAHFITGGSHYAPSADTTDDQGKTCELGTIVLLDRGVKGVHIDVQNCALRRHWMRVSRE